MRTLTCRGRLCRVRKPFFQSDFQIYKQRNQERRIFITSHRHRQKGSKQARKVHMFYGFYLAASSSIVENWEQQLTGAPLTCWQSTAVFYFFSYCLKWKRTAQKKSFFSNQGFPERAASVFITFNRLPVAI